MALSVEFGIKAFSFLNEHLCPGLEVQLGVRWFVMSLMSSDGPLSYDDVETQVPDTAPLRNDSNIRGRLLESCTEPADNRRVRRT